MASAKLANNTVNHSHPEMARMNHAGSSLPNRNAETNRPVVKMLPM